MTDNRQWFQLLVEEGSVTRAAARLHVTQQTLSARLAALEADLGAKLFERTAPLRLTRAGEEYAAYLREYEKLRAGFARRLDEVTHGTGGTLRIGVSHTRGRVLLPRVCEAFARMHPHTFLDVREGSNEEVLNLLNAEEVDVAIARFPDRMPGVKVVPVHEERLTLLVPRAWLAALDADAHARLQAGDLGVLTEPSGASAGSSEDSAPAAASSGLVSPTAPSGAAPALPLPLLACLEGDIAWRLGKAMLDEQGVRPFVRMRAGNIDTLIECCKRGLGAVFCPDVMLGACRKSTCVEIVPLGSCAAYSVGAGVLAASQPWRAREDFVELLTKQR
ncbi:MAG: LysR family transcriptional regulator [Eggerthellaceae bacterium]|nr:LysR family transcriptional regulator [Eggerthellaceae bacterium]